MVKNTTGNPGTQCRDQDGILPIRREAWKLIAPMPSTTGSQSIANVGTTISTPSQPSNPSNPPVPSGTPLPSTRPVIPNVPQIEPVSNNQGFPQGQFPFNQEQHLQHGAVQPGRQYPVMVPICWYYPYCQNCQQFDNNQFH